MVLSSQGDGDIESRFAHLIQPIRDLAKNWDVDIASQLEEYIQELDQITITFDDGSTTMNFAEAALLIQGSAAVYSRKVEYLYSLVYRVLDLLASKKKAKASSIDADGNDKDAPEDKGDEDEEFLSLDDIKEHKNIDMKNDHDDDQNLVHTIPRTPMALLPIEVSEKDETPLLSRGGEILGSRKDFKMNTCNIHLSGTMLLDMSHLSLLESSFLNRPCSTPYVPNLIRHAQIIMNNKDTTNESEPAADEGLPQCDFADDNDDEGAPFMDEDPLPPVADDLEEQPQEEQIALRRRGQRENLVIPVKPKVDPWIPLDPHSAETVTDKPFKKARTFRIPPDLLTEETKKRKRRKQPGTQTLIPIVEFCANAFHSCASKFPSNKLKVPDFPEFEQLYWKEFRRRQMKIRKDRKILQQQGRFTDVAEEEQDHENEEDYQDMPGGGDDGDIEGDYDNLEVDHLLPAAMDPLGLSNMPVEGDAPPPPFSPAAVEETRIISSYEELIRNHVDGFLASAQQYAQLTELSKRVSEWEEKIIPKLKQEEERGAFDIHKYGSKVLGTFEGDPDSSRFTEEMLPFKKVVENKEPYEVCRMFLATLQLANNYNVEIGCSGVLYESVDTMTLKLLSRKRHHEDLEAYRAPSIET